MKKLILSVLMALCTTMLFAQAIAVKGTVTGSEDGLPIIGAYILQQGTNNGAFTDIDGNYALKVPADASLLVSSVGFKTIVVPVNGKAVINISMQPDTQELDEVMVVAYGTATKASFTGSAGKIGSDKLELRPSTNPLNTLNGSTPGIRLTGANGQPGSDASITVRGIGSINGNTDPLIVLDGIIYQGVLSNIPSNEIESITILKDAASTALYGARAANGVLMVTTKQGKGEKTTISVKISSGFVTREQRDHETMGVKDYMETYWRLFYNNYVADGLSIEDAGIKASANVVASLNFSEDYNPWTCGINDVLSPTGVYNQNAQLKWAEDTDWRDGIEQVGFVQDYSLSASGRSGKTTYFASVGYADQEGYIVSSGFERYSARANIAAQPNKNIKFGVNASATYSTQYGIQSTSQGTTSNVFLIARRMPPVYPIHLHYPDGSYVYDENGNRIADFGEGYTTADGISIPGRKVNSGVNTPRQLKNRFNNRYRRGVDVKPYIEITFLKDFKFTANASYYNNDYKAHSATIHYSEKSSNTPSTTITNTQTQTWAFNQLLTWDKSFGKHNINVLLGHESNQYDYWNNTASKRYQIVIGDNYEFDNYIETSTEPSSYKNSYNTEGYFARANYDYNGKYFLSASFRRDGSSKFHKDARWGNFWSVGASWLVSNEEFIKNAGWIDNLKLRASIGTVGSDDLGSYFPWMALYVMNQNVDEPGYTQSMTTTGNMDLQWEVSTNWDAALEFSLFNSRLNGSLEYFHRKTTNLLMEVSLAPSSGLTSRNENAGGLVNRGLEFAFDYDIIRSKDVTWNLGINGTFLKNEIISLPVPPYTKNSSYHKVEEGHSVYEWWMYQWAGVDPQTGLCIYEIGDKYLDATDDMVEVNGKKYTTDISKAKEDYSGSGIPKVSGGISTSFTWKNFTLSADLYYQLGGKIYDSTYQYAMAGFTSTEFINLTTDLLGMWREPGDITDIPIISSSADYGTNIEAVRSTRWLMSSNMLEVNKLSLSYDFSKKICDKLRLGSLRVYVAADHLCVWNARRGLNTNYSVSQYDKSGDRFSPSRTVTAGINFTF